MNTHIYLITIEDDVEPTIVGPFKNEEERNLFSKEFREKYEFEGGIYPLDIESETPPKAVKARAYSGGFFNGDDEFEKDKGASVRPGPRNLAACYHLSEAQIMKVDKIMCRTHEGAPAILEMPEGQQELKECWIYASDWLQIGTITPKQSIRL